MKYSVILLAISCLFPFSSSVTFEPNWDSLDTRVAPEWYDKAKVGIFIHWGVFSVPSITSEWFWPQWTWGTEEILEYLHKTRPPGFTYQEFAREFTAEFFNPHHWAKLFQDAGAKYVVLTSKHHEGYTLWPSTHAYSWNSVDIGPHRDIVGDLSEAIRNSTDLKFGLYYSLLEWYHPLYLADQDNNYTTNTFYIEKVKPERRELVEKYKPEILWSDGDWEASSTYWDSAEFLAWLYNESPVKDTVIANDRWGDDTPCLHGDVFTCTDRYNPGVLQEHKWENALTLDWASWGYRRNADISSYMTPSQLITALVTTVSCGGNMLINVGPTKDGMIAPIYQERLLAMGTWLRINGEAIYETQPWTVQNDTSGVGVWYTQKDDAVYAITLSWPTDNILTLESVVDLFSESTQVVFLEDASVLQWFVRGPRILIEFPDRANVAGEWAWAIKIVA